MRTTRAVREIAPGGLFEILAPTATPHPGAARLTPRMVRVSTITEQATAPAHMLHTHSMHGRAAVPASARACIRCMDMDALTCRPAIDARTRGPSRTRGATFGISRSIRRAASRPSAVARPRRANSRTKNPRTRNLQVKLRRGTPVVRLPRWGMGPGRRSLPRTSGVPGSPCAEFGAIRLRPGRRARARSATTRRLRPPGPEQREQVCGMPRRMLRLRRLVGFSEPPSKVFQSDAFWLEMACRCAPLSVHLCGNPNLAEISCTPSCLSTPRS